MSLSEVLGLTLLIPRRCSRVSRRLFALRIIYEKQMSAIALFAQSLTSPARLPPPQLLNKMKEELNGGGQTSFLPFFSLSLNPHR